MKHLNEQCAVCGGDMVEKKVEKLLRGGNNLASVTVTAEVCLKCGERFYSPSTVRRFEEIETALETDTTERFRPIGQAYRVEEESFVAHGIA